MMLKPGGIFSSSDLGPLSQNPVLALVTPLFRGKRVLFPIPSIDQKIRILHLLDRIGVDTADIGLPGAGPHVVRDVERLAREIGEARLRIRANCAARTLIADVQPIAEVTQRTGVPIECCCFIG